MTHNKHFNILRPKATSRKSGLSNSTMYAWAAQGKFPKPIKLGPRASGWIESEIDDWLEQRVAESRKEPAA